MPWTAADMERKGAKQPAKAAGIANAVRADCLAKGRDESYCDEFAIRVALAKVNAPGRKE